MGGHVRLEEEHVLLRVQAAGDVLGQLVDRALAEFGRILPDGDGMEVGHEVETLIVVHPVRPVLDGPEIVPEMKIAAGLDAGQHSFLLQFFHVVSIRVCKNTQIL